MHYTQLTQEQRYQIYALMQTEHSQARIAAIIGKHKSTICRELQRNKGQRGYRPQQAHHKALGRRDHGRKRISEELWKGIETKLRLDWSPEQVSGWMWRQQAVRISHEWIYQYILADKQGGGDLYRHLRCQKKRRKRYGRYDRRGRILHQVSIEERPAIVDKRSRIGDWEVDTIIGKRHQQAIVTLTERKSRLSLLAKVEQRTADQVGHAIVALLQPLGDRLNTLTADNGKEFADHERIARALRINFFFAHPYAAWERGANENMNGLIRQYIPKRQDFAALTNEHLMWIMSRLNHRPRKCLDFQSPFEVFFDQSVALVT